MCTSFCSVTFYERMRTLRMGIEALCVCVSLKEKQEMPFSFLTLATSIKMIRITLFRLSYILT